MELRHVLFCLVLVGSITASVLFHRSVQPNLSVVDLLVSAQVIIFHSIAILKLNQVKKILGPKLLLEIKYAEIVFPLLPLVLWLYFYFIFTVSITTFVCGVILSINVGLAALCNRVLRIIGQKFRKVTVCYEKTGAAKLLTFASRIFYRLRLANVALSFFAAICVGLGYGDSLPKTIILVPLGFFFYIAVAMLVLVAELRQLIGFSTLISKRYIAIAIAEAEADTAIYVSDPRATKFLAPVKMVKALINEGIAITAIMRDAKGVDAMNSSGANPIFFAPTIRSLDLFARPYLKNIFYINDSIKNGHFIRFSQYNHIIVPTGKLLGVKQLPKCIEMYDIVVAPNRDKAMEWSSNLSRNSKVKIVAVETEKISEQSDTQIELPQKVMLSIYIDPSSKFAKGNMLIERLSGVVSEIRRIGNVRLSIVLQEKNKDFYQAFKKHLMKALKHSYAKSVTNSNRCKNKRMEAIIHENDVFNLVTILKGGKRLAQHIGDIELLHDGEPLSDDHHVIFLRDIHIPANRRAFQTGNLGQLIDKIRNNKGGGVPLASSSPIELYGSYSELLQNLYEEKKK